MPDGQPPVITGEENNTTPKPFQGEIMQCFDCGREEKSDIHVQSGWTAIDIEDIRVYICPTCWNKMNGYRLRWLTQNKK